MAPIPSTSTVTPAKKPAVRGAVKQFRKGTDGLIKGGSQLAKDAGKILKEDGVRLARGAGNVLRKGQHTVLACAGAMPDLVNR